MRKYSHQIQELPQRGSVWIRFGRNNAEEIKAEYFEVALRFRDFSGRRSFIVVFEALLIPNGNDPVLMGQRLLNRFGYAAGERC